MWQKVQDWAAYLLTLVNIGVWSWALREFAQVLRG